jgi:hypothetical protein
MLPTEFAIYQTRLRVEFFCVWHTPVIRRFWQTCRNMKNLLNAASTMSGPKTGRLAPPGWADFFWGVSAKSGANL